MKKLLALLSIVMLLAGTSGCSSCRGMFCKPKPTIAAPVYSRCAPVCNSNCVAGSMCTSPSADCGCGCESGSAVTYGYDGAEMPMGSVPMTLPAGTTFGQ